MLDFHGNKFMLVSFILPIIRRNFAKSLKSADEDNCYPINEEYGSF